MGVRAHLFVTGRVQGVFFRSRARSKARAAGATGWIKNLPDGRVEAIFEGDREAVEEMIDFCRVGPPRASVEGIETRWETYLGEHRNFFIL